VPWGCSPTSIDRQLAAHADAHIFTALPRSGRTRAARLLAEIGDCRAKFPTPESLACLAGAAPSTRRSGKLRAVTFRWACDKQLRDAVTDFAADSRHDNRSAADLYDRARARGHDHPHAVRFLARAWLFAIWHCWQQGTAYDPSRHHAPQRVARLFETDSRMQTETLAVSRKLDQKSRELAGDCAAESMIPSGFREAALLD
jgi:hypothetical protein